MRRSSILRTQRRGEGVLAGAGRDGRGRVRALRARTGLASMREVAGCRGSDLLAHGRRPQRRCCGRNRVWARSAPACAAARPARRFPRRRPVRNILERSGLRGGPPSSTTSTTRRRAPRPGTRGSARRWLPNTDSGNMGNEKSALGPALPDRSVQRCCHSALGNRPRAPRTATTPPGGRAGPSRDSRPRPASSAEPPRPRRIEPSPPPARTEVSPSWSSTLAPGPPPSPPGQQDTALGFRP